MPPALTSPSTLAPSALETVSTEDPHLRWARQGCGRGFGKRPKEFSAAPAPTPPHPPPQGWIQELGLGDGSNLTTPSRREYLWTSDSQQTQFT